MHAYAPRQQQEQIDGSQQGGGTGVQGAHAMRLLSRVACAYPICKLIEATKQEKNSTPREEFALYKALCTAPGFAFFNIPQSALQPEIHIYRAL